MTQRFVEQHFSRFLRRADLVGDQVDLALEVDAPRSTARAAALLLSLVIADALRQHWVRHVARDDDRRAVAPFRGNGLHHFRDGVDRWVRAACGEFGRCAETHPDVGVAGVEGAAVAGAFQLRRFEHEARDLSVFWQQHAVVAAGLQFTKTELVIFLPPGRVLDRSVKVHYLAGTLSANLASCDSGSIRCEPDDALRRLFDIEARELLVGAVVDDERLAIRVNYLALAKPCLESWSVRRRRAAEHRLLP